VSTVRSRFPRSASSAMASTSPLPSTVRHIALS
jgi:hypothetical protein